MVGSQSFTLTHVHTHTHPYTHTPYAHASIHSYAHIPIRPHTCTQQDNGIALHPPPAVHDPYPKTLTITMTESPYLIINRNVRGFGAVDGFDAVTHPQDAHVIRLVGLGLGLGFGYRVWGIGSGLVRMPIWSDWLANKTEPQMRCACIRESNHTTIHPFPVRHPHTHRPMHPFMPTRQSNHGSEGRLK